MVCIYASPTLFLRLASAPALSSDSAQGMWPHMVARCSAVHLAVVCGGRGGGLLRGARVGRGVGESGRLGIPSGRAVGWTRDGTTA